MNDFLFDQSLSRLREPLKKAAGVQVLEMYISALDAIMEQVLEGRDAGTYWAVWRPWVGHDVEIGGRQGRLVSVIRDDAIELARSGPQSMASVVRALMPRGIMPRRIAFFVLLEIGTKDRLAVDSLLSEELWRSRSAAPEAIELARSVAHRLGEEDLRSVEDWIARGPTIPYDDRQLTRRWKLRRLVPFDRHLSDSSQATLDQLEREFGETRAPLDTAPISASFVGPTSPMNRDTLVAGGSPAMLEILRSWEPSGGWAQPTPEGLGRVLQEAIKENPDLLAAFADETGLHPTYVRSVLQGIRDAVRAGNELDWGVALTYARRAALETAPVRTLSDDPFEADTDWSGVRRAAAWVVLTWAESSPTSWIRSHISAAADALATLSRDPDPSVDDELRLAEQDMDWSSLAINSTRPLAVLAAIRIAVGAGGLGWEPEAETALDLIEPHLDPNTDPSLAVAAVLGQGYAALVDAIGDRVSRLQAAFMPPDLELSDRWWAAWSAYIVFNAPTPQRLLQLRDQYSIAVMRTSSRPVWRFLDDPNNRLAEHLVVAIANEWLPLDDRLVLTAEEHAPIGFWVHALAFAGQAVSRESLGVSQVHALQTLWERRQEVADGQDGTHVEELAQFGWWSESGSIQPDWFLPRLDRVLQQTELAPGGDQATIERLVTLAPNHPGEVLRCAQLMVDRQTNRWRVYGWEHELREILELTANATDIDVGSARRDLASRLAMNWGILSFREFAS